MVYLCYTIVGYLSCRTWRSCLCLNAASGAPRRPMPPPALARSEFCCLQNFRFLEKHANERLIVTSVNVTMRAEFLIRLHSSCFYCCFCHYCMSVCEPWTVLLNLQFCALTAHCLKMENTSERNQPEYLPIFSMKRYLFGQKNSTSFF